MKLAAAAMVLAACSGGAQRWSFERPAIASAIGHAATFEQWIGPHITLGGLWFADPACHEFQAPQEVVPPRTKALAICLAGLPLVESKRRDALEDVFVLAYEPGFEVEARVYRDASGEHLTWIGFEAERHARDVLPTISGDAFEALRTAGDMNGALDPAVAASLASELPPRIKLRAAMAWFKVCIDTTGNISLAEPRLVSSIGARDSFLGAINDWQFRPFVAGGKPLAVCAMKRLVAPAEQAPPVEALPFPPPPPEEGDPLLVPEATLEHLAGQRRILPDLADRQELEQAGVSNVWGVFRICVDRKGNVTSVFPFNPTGVPPYDRKIELAVRDWRYTPYRDATGPAPVCTAQTFEFVVLRGRSRGTPAARIR